jgi:hypothetical protein
MDVELHAPFTSSPLDAYRGSGRHSKRKFIHSCPVCAFNKSLPAPKPDKILTAFITFAGCKTVTENEPRSGDK